MKLSESAARRASFITIYSLASAVLLILAIVSYPFHSLRAQNSPQPAPEKTDTVIHKDAALVTIDLLVTDKHGAAVTDLRPEEIKVYENGKEQKVQHFEHVNMRARKTPKIERAGWVDNIDVKHQETTSQTPIIVLLDAMNVSPQDESRARKIMLETLGKFPANQKVAVFLLGNKLKQLTGFTDDPVLLHKIVESVSLKHSSTLDSSNLLKEIGTHDEFAVKNSDGEQRLAKVVEMQSDLQSFSAERASQAVDLRVHLTIDALEAIAKGVIGVPGRKNLIWMSAAFPLNINPDSRLAAGQASTQGMVNPEINNAQFNAVRFYHEDINKLASHLTAARIALYPLEIRGLTSFMTSEEATPVFNPAGAVPTAPGTTIFDTGSASEGNIQHQSTIDTIKMMAEQTGGRAFFNTNDFTGSILKAMADGSDYYSLDYTPPNRSDDSIPRAILIKTTRSGLQLRYRRSYIPRPAKEGGGSELEQTLNPTLPLRDGIEIAASAQPCNAHTLTVAVAPADLQLGNMNDGRRVARLSVGYIAIPTATKGGVPLRSMRDLELPLDLTQVERAKTAGIPITLRIDVPEGDYLVRVGVYDRDSRRSGSVDVSYLNHPCTNMASASSENLPPMENLLPEEGSLTDSMYENRYYGFRMELPKVPRARRQRLEVMPSGIHALLALELENHLHKGYVAVYAIESSSGEAVDAAIAAQQEVRNATALGRNILEGPMERNGKQGRFWVLLEQGPQPQQRTLVYLVPRRDALLKIAGTSDDEEMYKNMATSFGHLEFTEVRGEKPQHEYLGPTIPEKWVDDAISSKSGSRFNDLGTLTPTAYSNPSIGLEFAVPNGWETLDASSGEALYERMHSPDAADKSAVREHALFRACSRPLFFLRDKKPESQVQTASLFVVDQNCLRVQFPSNTDVPTMSEFASSLSLFHDFGQPKKAGMVKVDDRPFVTLRGELAYAGADSKLQTRRWQTAYVTAFKDKLLIWFWSYPRSGMKDEAVVTNIKLK